MRRGEEPENPFTREGNTEKILLKREREREVRDFTRGDKDTLRVFEKGIATRQNRAGVIREVNGILPSKKYSATTGELAIYNPS